MGRADGGRPSAIAPPRPPTRFHHVSPLAVASPPAERTARVTTLADPDHSPHAPSDPHPVPPRDGEGPRIGVVVAMIVAFVALVAAIYLGVESRSAGQSRDGLQTRLATAEQELAALKQAGGDRDALKVESDRLQAQIGEAKTALDQIGQRRDQATRDADAAAAQARAAQDQAKAADSQLAEKQAAAADLNGQLDQLRAQEAAQRESYGRLNADSAAVNGQLAQATDQLGKTQGDLAAARQQLADLQAQIARTADELKRQSEAAKP